MEVEGGDGIKGLTRLGWHTLLRRAVLPGLSAHSAPSVCVCVCVSSTCVTALRTLELGFVCVQLLDAVTILLILVQLYNKAAD